MHRVVIQVWGVELRSFNGCKKEEKGSSSACKARAFTFAFPFFTNPPFQVRKRRLEQGATSVFILILWHEYLTFATIKGQKLILCACPTRVSSQKEEGIKEEDELFLFSFLTLEWNTVSDALQHISVVSNVWGKWSFVVNSIK